jgi:hypothetical protein
MCGRYGRRADKQRIAEWMQTHNTDVFDDSYLAPSYNVAPQSFQPVVRLDSETGERELTIMRWGLIPFWSKDGEMAFNTINAKAESLTGKPVQALASVRPFSGAKPHSALERKHDKFMKKSTDVSAGAGQLVFCYGFSAQRSILLL